MKGVGDGLWLVPECIGQLVGFLLDEGGSKGYELAFCRRLLANFCAIAGVCNWPTYHYAL